MNDSSINPNDFSNKTMMEAYCVCGQANYVFLPSLNCDYLTKCKKCGNSIFELYCPTCKSGYSIPENDKTFLHNLLLPNKKIKITNQTWKCDTCGAVNHIPKDINENIIPSYSEDEIPEEVWKANFSNENRLKYFLIITVIIIIAYAAFGMLSNLIFPTK